MVEPVLPGARGPSLPGEAGAAPAGPVATAPVGVAAGDLPGQGAGFGASAESLPSGVPTPSGSPIQASEPAPLFGPGRKGQAPGAVLSVAGILPAEVLAQLAARAEGPRLAPLLATLFPVAQGREDDFATEALRDARLVQERAATLTADVARRDLHGRVARLAERLMDHASPTWKDRMRRALGGGERSLDGGQVRAELLAIQRELNIVLAPAERLVREAEPALEELALCRAALELAQPWLDAAGAARRLRLLEAAHNGCGLVPAQARHLVLQLEELADRLQTVENATLPAVLNAQAARRLGESGEE